VADFTRRPALAQRRRRRAFEDAEVLAPQDLAAPPCRRH
jgi:hypothetical protein